MKKLFLVFLLFVSFSLEASKYRLVVGSMFKNEAPWLKEWIEYYRLLGVERFYLYNNDSDDNYREILDPYIEQDIVELIEWDSKTAPWHKVGLARYMGFQISAFNDCIKRALGKADWVAIIDIDEFIVPPQGVLALHAFLDRTLQTNIGTLTFLWKWYGTSGVWNIPEGTLMTEALFMRTEDGGDFYPNTLGKCLHRPEAVEFCDLHSARLKNGFRQQFIWDVRINHYVQRGMQETLKKRCKIPISNEQDLTPQAIECLKILDEKYNQIEDRAIWPFLPALKKAMKFK